MSHHDKLAEVLHILAEGGNILLPTDTVWGVACDATNPDAVQRVRDLLQRPSEQGLVVITESIQQLRQYVIGIHPRIENVLAFHTRPLTVVYEGANGLAPGIGADDDSIAVRVVQDPFCRLLIREFGKPLVCAAAHINGQSWPASFGNISSDILQGVNHVIQYRQNDPDSEGPSVIARYIPSSDEIEFLRN